nr:P2 protein [Schistosoma japonicum]
MICLQSIISLCKVVSPSLCCQYLLPTALSMHTDNVPNVRFKVAQALSNLGSQLDEKSIENEVKSCLVRLSEDADTDVKFYAYEAMDTLKITTNKPFQCYYIKIKPNSNVTCIQPESLSSSTTTIETGALAALSGPTETVNTLSADDHCVTIDDQSLSSLNIVGDTNAAVISNDMDNNTPVTISQSPYLVNAANIVDDNVNGDN